MNTGASWPSLIEAGLRILAMQTKLHQWATVNPDRCFDDLFNLVYDPAFLVVAWSRVREKTIPKASGKVRSLGIPTTRDRVVQAASKLVLQPIFEADFKLCSYGFRQKCRDDEPRQGRWSPPTRQNNVSSRSNAVTSPNRFGSSTSGVPNQTTASMIVCQSHARSAATSATERPCRPTWNVAHRPARAVMIAARAGAIRSSVSVHVAL